MFQGSRQVPGSGHFTMLQSVGASLNGTTSFDRTNYFETVPPHALDLALWLEADRMGSLLEAVTQENLDNQRDVVKNERRQRYDNVPYGTAYEQIFAGLFPEGHPYHHLPIGSMEDLDAASLEDVHAFFETWYAPDNAVLSIVGDVEPEQAVALADSYFGGIPARGGFPQPRDGAIGPLEAPLRIDVDDPEVPNQALYLTFRVPPDGAPECDAADLALAVLAGGDSSRLVSRLVRRERVAQFVHGGVQRLVGGSAVGLIVLHAMPDADLARVEGLVGEELARVRRRRPHRVGGRAGPRPGRARVPRRHEHRRAAGRRAGALHDAVRRSHRAQRGAGAPAGHRPGRRPPRRGRARRPGARAGARVPPGGGRGAVRTPGVPTDEGSAA